MHKRILAGLLTGAMIILNTGSVFQAAEYTEYTENEAEVFQTESAEDTAEPDEPAQEQQVSEEHTVTEDTEPSDPEQSAPEAEDERQDPDPVGDAVVTEEDSAEGMADISFSQEIEPEELYILQEENYGKEAPVLEAVPSYSYSYTYKTAIFQSLNGVNASSINSAAEAIIIENEGGYATVVANDAGALSIGKMQWHGGRALELLRLIVSYDNLLSYNTLGSKLYNEIISSKTNWDKRTLGSAESTYIKNLLNSTVGRRVQDALSKSDIYVYINHGYRLGLRNAAALVYFADIENQFGSGGCLNFVKYAGRITGNNGTVTLNELHLGSVCYLIDRYSNPYLSYLIPRRRTTYGSITKLGWTYHNSGDYRIPYDSDGMTGLAWTQNALNYYQNAGLKVDGTNGTQTKKAIMTFQKAVGQSADGLAGLKTSSILIGKLYGTLARTGNADRAVPLYGSGTAASTKPGKWVRSGSLWWYRHTDGSYSASAWEYIDGHWYYFDRAGWMVTGWLAYNGQWYYLSQSGAMVTGWLYAGGEWYYMNASGAMQTGWVSSGGKWYYMDASGVMQTGWVSVSGKWYYLNSNGSMASSQWIGQYYVNANGVWTKTR